MKFPRALPCWVLLLLSAPAILTACTSAPVVYKDRVVTVPQPIRTPVDPRLTEDCSPRFDLPSKPTVEDSWKRLAAVEESLTQCRKQLSEIRDAK